LAQPISEASIQKNKYILTPVRQIAGRQAQCQQLKVRYRTAGRVLQARSEGSVLWYSTRASSAARRAPAQQDRTAFWKKAQKMEA